MSRDFSGCFVAMITPFTEEGGLDVEGLRENVEWMIAEGVHGLIPSGSAGEFLQLSDDERATLIESVVEVTAGRVPVIAGISSDWTDEAVNWAQFAQDVGADGVMVAPPFYSQPDEDEVLSHYAAIGEATALPVMVYNNPATTGIDLDPVRLARISTLPNMRYVKESTRDVRRIAQIERLSEGRLQVFAGIHALESLRAGAVGWVSVPGNVLPRASAQLCEAAAQGEDDRSQHESDVLWDIMELEDRTGKYVQLYKRALELMGRPAGAPRAPRLRPLPPLELELADVLRRAQLIA
jgi:4-hydroxy-tetrahydrodipicolinate synthase